MNTFHHVQTSDRTACIHAGVQRTEGETCDGIIFRFLFILSSIMHACLDYLKRGHNDGPSLLPPIHFTVFEQHLRAATSQYLILNASGRSGILLPLVGHTNGRRNSTITKPQNFFISSTSPRLPLPLMEHQRRMYTTPPGWTRGGF